MADANYYELLGVTPEATQEEIRAAFHELAKRVHPDSGGNKALFRSVNTAYETLRDPTRRAAYDRNNFIDEPAAHSDAAPGWRRTDDQGNADGDGATSESKGHEPPSGGPREPPWNPPPPPPPTSSASDPNPSAASPTVPVAHNALRVHSAANPSVALLIAGLVVLVFATRVGGATANVLVLGFVLAGVGFVGVLGRNKAAKRAAAERLDSVRIDAMTESEFERRLLAAFQHVGYTVYRVSNRGDCGADLVLDLPGSRTVVHAKEWYHTVGPEAVQEVIASRSHYNVHYAIVVTSILFTDAAIDVARSHAVELWDRERLIGFLVAQELGPPRTGAVLLGDELRAGAPRALRGGFTVLVALLAAAASSKSRRRGRR